MTGAGWRPALATLLDRLAIDQQVSRADLTGTDRRAATVRLRFAFVWAARNAGYGSVAAIGRGLDDRRIVPVIGAQPVSFTVIGHVLGGRRRQTIAGAHRAALVLRERDPGFRALTDRLLAAGGQAR